MKPEYLRELAKTTKGPELAAFIERRAIELELEQEKRAKRWKKIRMMIYLLVIIWTPFEVFRMSGVIRENLAEGQIIPACILFFSAIAVGGYFILRQPR